MVHCSHGSLAHAYEFSTHYGIVKTWRRSTLHTGIEGKKRTGVLM